MKCAHSAPDMDRTAPPRDCHRQKASVVNICNGPTAVKIVTTGAIQRQGNIHDTVDKVACQLFNSRGSNSSCMGNATKGGMALTLKETNTPHSIKIFPLQEQSNTYSIEGTGADASCPHCIRQGQYSSYRVGQSQTEKQCSCHLQRANRRQNCFTTAAIQRQ